MSSRTKMWLKPTDQMDLWLETQGYYRKHTARDATCLFRAVSEQLFLTQAFHLEVRRQCVQYSLMFKDKFQKKLQCPLKEHADRMLLPTEWGGNVELEIMSLMYKCDFILFQDVGKPADFVTNNGFEKKLMLCLSQEKHYDSVFTKQHITNSAFCQSLIYEELYKGVFRLLEVDYAVKKMLHDKTPRYQRDPSCFLINGMALRLEMRDSCLNVKELLALGVTPFPYKVAKSLDSEIYRNVEYDTWNDYRKGLRYGSRFWSNHELCVGVKCLVKLASDRVCHAFIQEMEPDKGPVLVFVEELGEKMTVPYENLELLPQQTTQLALPSPASSLKPLRQIQTTKTAQQQPESLQQGKKNPKGVGSGRLKGKELQVGDSKRKGGNCIESNEQANSVTVLPNSGDCYAQDLEYQQEIYDSYHGQPYLTQSCEVTSSVSELEEHHDMKGENGMVGHRPGACPPTSLYQPHASMPDPNASFHHYQLSPTTAAPAYCTVNIVPTRSVLPDGSDLPMADIPTLRYFYNLGLDQYMRMSCVVRPGAPPQCYPVIQSPAPYMPEPAHVSYVSYEQPPPGVPPTSPDAVPMAMFRLHKDVVPSSFGGISVTSESEASENQSPTRSISTSHPQIAPRFKNKRKNGNQNSTLQSSQNGNGHHSQQQQPLQNGGGSRYKGTPLAVQQQEISTTVLSSPVTQVAPSLPPPPQTANHYVPVQSTSAYSSTVSPAVYYHPVECDANYCPIAGGTAGSYMDYNNFVYDHSPSGMYPAVYTQPAAPAASYVTPDGLYYQPIVQPTTI